jgi:O-antigen/teichoic acid export membrane protein
MSRTSRYLKGLAGNYVGQAIILLAGLWLTRFLLARLGQEEFGLWLIVLQVLATLELTDLGVMAVLPREVAYRAGDVGTPGAGRDAVRDLLSAARRVSLWQLPAVAAAAVALWAILLGARPDHPATLPLAVAAACYLVAFPFRVYGAALQGLQDLLFLSTASTGMWLCQSAVSVVLVASGWGFWSLLGGWAAGRCFSVVACRCRLGLTFPGLAPAALGRRHPDGARLLRSGLWVSLGNVALMLQSGADVLILGALCGPAAVVVYTCTAKLIQLGTTQLVALVMGTGPALAELSRDRSVERRCNAWAALSQLVLLCTAGVAALFLTVNAGFVGWWVGPGRYGGTALTVLLAAVLLARQTAFLAATLLFWMGRERSLPLIYLGDGLLTAGTTALLAAALGPLAAPIGSLAGVCVAGLPVYAWLLAREADFSFRDLLRPNLRLLWRVVPFLAAAACLGPALAPFGLPGALAAAAAAAALYAALSLPAVRHTPLWPYLARHLAPLAGPLERLRAYRVRRRREADPTALLAPPLSAPALAEAEPKA